MAVFRIEKTRDYTVMSNHHLRNTALSLKAKGLLSLMLSLPEGWDYTTKGLARICKDGVDSICAGVRELEEQGYESEHPNPHHLGYIKSLPQRLKWSDEELYESYLGDDKKGFYPRDF